jgi:kynurenine/2-aminoadipate aminotransferase
MNYSKFFSRVSANRKPSAIRELAKFTNLPEMISLGGGYPNSSQYPIDQIELTVNSQKLVLSQEELNLCLQYSSTPGIAPLLKQLHEIQKIHSIQYDADICVGTGSQDLLTKAFEMLLNPGDTILLEAPTYVGILAFLKPLGLNFLEINSDYQGLDPEHLEQLLESCDENSRPKVLYTVPIAGNPTGVSTSVERKRRVYAIAQKYDLIIMEDDPYYYLQFETPWKPSYLSLDTDGRVIRFDSFSKILSGGCRLGFCTGPKPLIERIVLHMQATSLHASGMSQIVVYKVLQLLGTDGFYEHCQKVAQFYKDRCDYFVSCLEKHLKGKAEWVIPDSGMFVWLKLLGVEDSFELITTKARDAKVLLVPGQEFFANPRKTGYVRACYSVASQEDMELAIQRLASLL